MKKIFTNLSLVLSLLLVLNIGNSLAQCTANFNYTLNANGNVQFESANASTNTNPTSYYSWNFGNSATSTGSTVTFPSATYTANGTYIVSLIFTTTVPSCSVSSQQTITISNIITSTCNVNANFSSTQGSNGQVTFTSTSTGTVAGTTYAWNYGDASVNGSGVSTSHTYSSNGVYSVILYANNNFTSTCMDSSVISVFVNSYPCVLNANFSFTQGANGLVNFSSTSTGTIAQTTYSWSFGNNTFGSGANPSQTYVNNGTFTVTLSAMNNFSNCVSTTSQVVTVTSNTCNINAGFTNTQGANGLVNFNSTSTGTNANTSYYWNFGDGFTSTSNSPSHTYTSSGAYSVYFKAYDSNNIFCKDSIIQLVNVTSAPCVANSNFSLAPNTSTTSFVWDATPASPWNVVAATWSWGDNSVSNTLYTSHTYSASGTYSICLTVTVSCGGSSSTCVNQFIFKTTSSQNMQMIQVNVVAPALIPTGIKNAEIETINYEIYPNPNNGQFELKLNNSRNEIVKIKVYSLIGELVYETDTKNDNLIKNINLSDVSNGVYFIKVNSNNKELTKKIIIAK
ncbi:MAG: PKD domain-containing protein [Bacteroidota bacterium]|nr:PKD domain-containing protein [Bacteroidota bacterium]MDP3146260.1 PKD domain-containing protein [Bacteroidota bacterium]MDP3556366.1 PKD domain-containing protein [Bacteroidota bacterium]